MNIVGIDFSLTAPAVALLSPDNKIIATKHWAYQPIHESHIHRCIWLAKEITSFIIQHKPDRVFIEQYAFSANGRITDIAEGAGVLKVYLVSNNLVPEPVAISSWKKALTNNGKADKTLIRETVNRMYGLSLTSRKGDQDVADAIGIAYYAYTQRQRLVS